MNITTEILERYNQPGPRYTSYPPANYFEQTFTPEEYLQLIDSSNKNNPNHISLYIHIPFCRRMCFFCGCNAMRYPSYDFVDRYIDALIKEIDTVSKRLNDDRLVTQIHWGGGTPNAISIEQIDRIMTAIKDRYNFHQSIEIAIECNPALLTEEYVQDLKKIGFNRFSLGIQDFDTKVLAAVNRQPSKLPLEELLPIIKEGGNVGVNLDFIYGLPYQSVDSFLDAIKKAISLSPERLVTFSYAHVPWVKKAQKKLETYNLPDPEAKLQMLIKSHQLLSETGYKAIGMDHFAKPEDELSVALDEKLLHRNFQGYCTRETTGQVYAFGTSSITQLWDGYVQNEKDVKTYIERIEKDGVATAKGYVLNHEEIVIREVINELMCNFILNWERLSARIGVSIDEIKRITEFDPTRLTQFQDDNLIVVDDQYNITVNKTGEFFIRNIVMTFDPKLKNSNKSFSKTI
ncbi:oxygen-independent coproporphyrinogen III oxidase [Puteibacter caeruleilacunae]|nr:oxygen-independent coproporphyrinogen III oxidase [Puteibacter caeruleilacunae]